VNYPCDTAGKYPYMNVEIVAVKLQGTYSCGVQGKDPGVLRSGWGHGTCNCDNALEESNCGRLIRSLSRGVASLFEATSDRFTQPESERGQPPVAAPSDRAVGLVTDTVEPAATASWETAGHLSALETTEPPIRLGVPGTAGDCTRNHSSAADPPWFATCKEDACLRVTIKSSSLRSLNVGNTTRGPTFGLGFYWCIDHLNQVVYAKMNATHQPDRPPYYAAFFEIDYPARPGRLANQTASCRFLTTHWASGDAVLVFQEDMLNCTLIYASSQLPGPDGVTHAVVYVA